MRLAILNRERSAFPGGDNLSIDDTIAALEPLGIHATLMQGWWKPTELKGYDAALVYHCNFSWSQYNFEGVRAAGIPYVMRPMFYPRLDLGMGADDIRMAVDCAAAVVPMSWREWDEMQRMCGPTDGSTAHRLEHRRVEAIPNGVSERFHYANANGGTSRRGVLCVAARAGDKNCRKVEDACMRLGLPYKQATTLDYKFMPLVYRAFRVFVNASDSERMSRTVGEALCAGCRVLAPKGDRGGEWYGKGLHVIDPDDEAGMQEAVDYAYHAPNWDYSPNERARTLTWRKTAERMAEVLREVVAARAVGA